MYSLYLCKLVSKRKETNYVNYKTKNNYPNPKFIYINCQEKKTIQWIHTKRGLLSITCSERKCEETEFNEYELNL